MKIYILGCGALGSNIAMNLAYDRRDDDLVLLDFDKVEPRNYQFGTQLYALEQRGRLKVDALSFNIWRATGRQPLIIGEKISTEFYDLPEKGLMIDCFDNHDARLSAKTIAALHDYPCLHVGFSPLLTFSIEWNANYEAPSDYKQDFDICTAQGARSFVHYVSGLATLTAIEFLETGEKKEFMGNRFSVQEIK